MNESFVENYIQDAEIRNCEKYECRYSTCGEYLAVSIRTQDDLKANTLIFYDNENRLIEPQTHSNDHLGKLMILSYI